MARRPSTPTPTPQPANLTAEEMRRGVERLRKRLLDVEGFHLPAIRQERSPEVQALETSIEETLARVFGQGTQEYNRYLGAANIEPIRMVFGGRELSPQEVQGRISRGLDASRATLSQAIKGLEEEITEHSDTDSRVTDEVLKPQAALSRKVFVVHGHDEGAREQLATFLRKADFEPTILHEHANQGRTVIEKVEAHSEVGFAVVLLTPDDVGGLNDGQLQPRARQNVLLELGYFVGKLGREHVCAMKRGDVEVPSDWQGVVNTEFDAHGGWRTALARELEAAGHEINWRKALS